MGTIHLPPTGKDSLSYHSPSTSASSTYCLQQHHMINNSKDYNTSLHRDGHHSSTSNRHVSERAKTSCSAPTQSRSPSAHRSRSVSAALRQAGSPVKTWRSVVTTHSSDIIGLSLKEVPFLRWRMLSPFFSSRPPFSLQIPAALVWPSVRTLGSSGRW